MVFHCSCMVLLLFCARFVASELLQVRGGCVHLKYKKQCCRVVRYIAIVQKLPWHHYLFIAIVKRNNA